MKRYTQEEINKLITIEDNIKYIKNVNFDNCDLSNLDLSFIKFIDCSFRRANLEGAYLLCANLGAYLEGADLKWANFWKELIWKGQNMKSFNTQINIDESLLEKKFIVCDRHGTTEALFNNSCLQCFQEEENKLKEIEELKVFSDKQTRSGIVVNSIYRNATFDNYFCNNNEQKQFKETLDSYNYNSNLILSGNCGTGKTHLAIALVNRALKTEKQCYYIAFYEIAKIYVKNSVLFDYLINVDFLVIDEFGIQDTEFKSGVLFEILDKRAIINKPTCLITNLDIKEFTDRISIAVQSRLKINCTVVQGMDWQDYRIYKNN